MGRYFALHFTQVISFFPLRLLICFPLTNCFPLSYYTIFISIKITWQRKVFLCNCSNMRMYRIIYAINSKPKNRAKRFYLEMIFISPSLIMHAIFFNIKSYTQVINSLFAHKLTWAGLFAWHVACRVLKIREGGLCLWWLAMQEIESKGRD